MFIRPHSLAIITTHQCTAACDHCCFTCSPYVTKSLRYERMEQLIDEAAQIPSLCVISFTGGECFLLGDKLDALISRASGYGLVTRCVTNGYWAVTPKAAEQRVAKLVKAGLKEINFSTGTFHSRYVPVQRVINAACACVQAGLTTLINIEICNESDFKPELITEHPVLAEYIANRSLTVQRSVWIEAEGISPVTHPEEHSRFNPDRKSGCQTMLNVLAVTPDEHLVACCGLHLERIPDLHLGSVSQKSIRQVLDEAPDDFLKIWIHVEGPERILEFVKRYVPDYELPVHSAHPCETCLRLHKDKVARTVIREHYREVEDEVVSLYLAGMASNALNTAVLRQYQGQQTLATDEA
jgi:pyruvate-formate lyase-activating enzyme